MDEYKIAGTLAVHPSDPDYQKILEHKLKDMTDRLAERIGVEALQNKIMNNQIRIKVTDDPCTLTQTIELSVDISTRWSSATYIPFTSFYC